MKKNELSESLIHPYEEYTITTFRAVKPVSVRYKYSAFEQHHFKLMCFIKQTKKSLGGRLTGKHYVKYHSSKSQKFPQQGILEIDWMDKREETGSPDVRFTLYYNLMKDPNRYIPRHSFFLSDHISTGAILATTIQNNWYYRENQLSGKIKFDPIEDYDDIYFGEDEFKKVINKLEVGSPDRDKYEKTNRYLSGISNQRALSPLEQDRVLDALTLKYDMTYLDNNGSYLPFTTLTRALRNTNYKIQWATNRSSNWRLWGSVYLIERLPDEIIDIEKECFMEFVDAVMLVKLDGFEKAREQLVTRPKKNLDHYIPFFCQGREAWRRLWVKNYGSLKTFLDPRVGINKYKNNPSFLHRETEKIDD